MTLIRRSRRPARAGTVGSSGRVGERPDGNPPLSRRTKMGVLAFVLSMAGVAGSEEKTLPPRTDKAHARAQALNAVLSPGERIGGLLDFAALCREGDEVRSLAAELLRDRDPHIRRAAATALPSGPLDESTLSALTECLSGHSVELARTALWCIALSEDSEITLDRLSAGWSAMAPAVRTTALNLDRHPWRLLQRGLSDGSEVVVLEAIQNAKRRGALDDVHVLSSIVDVAARGNSAAQRMAAYGALESHRRRLTSSHLLALVKSEHDDIASRGWGEVRHSGATSPELLHAAEMTLKFRSAIVAQTCCDALAKNTSDPPRSLVDAVQGRAMQRDSFASANALHVLMSWDPELREFVAAFEQVAVHGPDPMRGHLLGLIEYAREPNVRSDGWNLVLRRIVEYGTPEQQQEAQNLMGN